MHFTLLVAGALIPGEIAIALSDSLNTPQLKARLARATLFEEKASATETGSAHLDWLARHLFSHAAPAPYAYAQLSGAASAAFIWHTDPVHIEIARDHLIVQSLGDDRPLAEESAPLLAIANELAHDVACEFIGIGDRWLMRSEHDWAIDNAPLAAIVEAPMLMPTGNDAPLWNRLHNEIQMAWHSHTVNQVREAAQRRTINGIWLHGGGRWKPLPPIEYTQVQSDAPELQGVAHAAGARGAPLHATVVDGALLVFDDLSSARRLEDWSTWLQAMTTIDQRLAAHASDAIDLILCGNTVRTFKSRPSDRYKPWRRRTLAQALTE